MKSTFACGVLFASCALVACGPATDGSTAAETAAVNDPTSSASALQSVVSEASSAAASAESENGDPTPPAGAGANRMALTTAGGCVAVTTNPSPLDPNNLPLQFSIDWTYTNCIEGLAGVLSGTRDAHVSRDPNGQSRTVVGTIALTRTFADGRILVNDANHMITSQGLRNSGTVTHQVQAGGHRTLTKASGKERFDHTFVHNFTAVDSFDANSALTRQVLNGSGTLDHNLIGAVSDATFTGLTLDTSCAWPISGSLEIKTTFKNGNVTDNTYVWGPNCGDLTINNVKTQLAAP